MAIDDRDWLYSFILLFGVGRKTIRNLYQQFGSFDFISEKLTDEQAQMLGIVPAKLNLIRQVTPEKVKWDQQNRMKAGITFVSMFDKEYPTLLSHIADPPLLLFYNGNLDLLDRMAIGVVGTRKPTAYGRSACQYFVQRLCAAGVVIVSGLAAGIDAEAHRVALRQGGETIAVLGCGIDQIYPRQNHMLYQEIASKGLLLSEYPPGVEPRPGLFPERNRIISGLSRGVLIVEAAERSGSLITADLAVEQGREVFSVPGPIFSGTSMGSNALIKQGAKLVTSIEDIVEEFPDLMGKTVIKIEEFEKIIVTQEETTLLSLFSDEPLHWDELYSALPKDLQQWIDRDLVRLEAKGLIESLPGGYYVKCTDRKFSLQEKFDK